MPATAFTEQLKRIMHSGLYPAGPSDLCRNPFYAEMVDRLRPMVKSLDALGEMSQRRWQMFKKHQRTTTPYGWSSCSTCLWTKNTLLAIDTNRRHRIMKNHTATTCSMRLFTISLVNTQPEGISQWVRILCFDSSLLPSCDLVKNCYWTSHWKRFKAIAVVKTIETEISILLKQMGAAPSLSRKKYGKEVRVVTIGDYSVKFCGGTHVGTLWDRLFKIVKEEGIGSGTRRILAVTGKEAFEAYCEQEDALKAVAATLKALNLRVPQGGRSSRTTCQLQKKRNAELKKAAAAGRYTFKNVQQRYVTAAVSKQMQVPFCTLVDNFRNKKDYLMCLFCRSNRDKVNVLVASKHAQKSMQVVIKELAHRRLTDVVVVKPTGHGREAKLSENQRTVGCRSR